MQRLKQGIRFVFAVVVALVAAPSAWSQGFDLRDPILPDISTVQQARAPAALAAASRTPLTTDAAPSAPRALPGGTRGATFVQTLSLRQELLRGPAILGQAGQSMGFKSTPAAAGVLALTLEGRSYELSIVSQAIDPKFAMRHVTLQVLGVAGGYARFSVSGDALIVGTVHTPQATYRIVPIDATTQQVYRVRADSGTKLLRYVRVARDAGAQISNVERRHVQLEQLADIHPEFAITSRAGGTLNIQGGRLGKLASGKVTAATLLAALAPHAELTLAPAKLQIRIQRVSGSGSARRIEFEQLINGIPVSRRNLVNLYADGTIREIRTSFVAPELVENVTILSEQQALEHAVTALEEKFRARLGEVELVKPTELHYDLRPFEQHLVPEYRFSVDTGAHGSWWVTVNAHTGASDIRDPRLFADTFGYRVCRTTPPTASPITCSDPGAVVMWNNPLGGTGNCPFADPMSGANPCTMLDPGRAHSALLNADRALKDIHLANPDYCCDLLGGADRSIDLVYRTNGAVSDAYYSIFSESLVSAPGSSLFQSIDVVWHELGHHYLFMYNPGLFSLPPAGQRFANAFHEGFADAFSSSIALNTPSALSALYGEAWVVGDGPNGVGTTRDLRVDQLFTQLNDLTQDVHDRGQVIANYFYRVKTVSGISNRRILELVMNVGDRLVDYDGNGMDVFDFKTAVLNSISASETALLNAANSVFTAMGQVPGGGQPPIPPGQPAPPGAPGAPVPLVANWLGCGILSNGQGATTWILNWPSVSGASSYVAYLQSLSSPWIYDSAITSSNSIDAYITGTGHQAVSFVAACGIGGCSNTSNPAVISMLPQCFH